MQQSSDYHYEESFNSFLAGALLARGKINNFDFFNLIEFFEKTYNVDVVSVGDDIWVPIYFNDDQINLINDLDTEIDIDGKITTIRDYLYSYTTNRVRNFFGISEYNENKKNKPFIRCLFKKKLAI